MMNCRICNTQLNEVFLSLGNSPLSNSYLSYEQLNKMEPYYPLELYVCHNCYLVQIDEFEKSENIFSIDYAYHSSFSQSWLDHCKNYTEMIIKKFNLNETSFVLEVASNDGYLLQYFNEINIPVLGVEPTEVTANVAINKGIKTDICFFNEKYAVALKEKGKLADLIIANNVLAHNPYLNDFVAGLKIALKQNGLITLEFPHLLSLFNNIQFDTIYHEHFSYFSLYSVRILFSNHGMEIFDVEQLSTHGGSLRIYVKHKEDKSKNISSSILDIIDKEKENGLLKLDTYKHLNSRVEKIKRNLLKLIIKLKEEDKTIIGYGAPAKGNTLLNYCGIRTDFIEYTVDLSPYKQNKFLPGSHIPIKNPEQIKIDKPDYILILPWNLRDEIIEQLEYTRSWNAKFIIPIPEVEIF